MRQAARDSSLAVGGFGATQLTCGGARLGCDVDAAVEVAVRSRSPAGPRAFSAYPPGGRWSTAHHVSGAGVVEACPAVTDPRGRSCDSSYPDDPACTDAPSAGEPWPPYGWPVPAGVLTATNTTSRASRNPKRLALASARTVPAPSRTPTPYVWRSRVECGSRLVGVLMHPNE